MRTYRLFFRSIAGRPSEIQGRAHEHSFGREHTADIECQLTFQQLVVLYFMRFFLRPRKGQPPLGERASDDIQERDEWTLHVRGFKGSSVPNSAHAERPP